MEKNRNNKLSIGSANFGLFYTSDKIKLKKKEIFQILNLAKKIRYIQLIQLKTIKKVRKLQEIIFAHKKLKDGKSQLKYQIKN